jgi:hypothetical protein
MKKVRRGPRLQNANVPSETGSTNSSRSPAARITIGAKPMNVDTAATTANAVIAINIDRKLNCGFRDRSIRIGGAAGGAGGTAAGDV